MDDEKYLVLSKEDCPFCERAMNLLDEKRASYSIIKIDTSDETKDSWRWFFEAIEVPKTVPQIFQIHRDYEDSLEGLEYIGGYEELVILIRFKD